MDITPYQLIELDANTSSLVLKAGRKKFNRLYRLFFPSFLLLASLWFLFVLDKRDMPGWANWLPLLLIVVALMLLFSTYTLEARFNSNEIRLIRKTTFSRSTTILPVSNQKNIATKATPLRDGGNYIYVIDKNGKKNLLLLIPYLNMDESKANYIAQAISDKTGLPIEKI